MTRLLILGGTGFVGRALLSRLVEHSHGAGQRLRVPTRRLGHARRIQSLPGVEPVQANVHHPTDLKALVQGVDAVVNLVAILHGSQADFERVHVELPRKLAAACDAAGVRRLVHVSALGLTNHAPSNYLRSKAAGEAVLRAAPLDLTVLRPSVIFGEEDRFLNLFAKLQGLFPMMPLAGAEARFQPVWVEDVAEAIARCLERPQTIGRVYECAGPSVYTLRELVQRAGTWSGHPRPVIGLPMALGRLQARLMELAPGEPLMSRDNLDSMRTPNIASSAFPGLEALGIQPTALEAIGPAYLGTATAGRGRLNRLRAHARRS